MTSRGFSRGFTLIELMMVVAIIGLLAAIALPKIGNMLTRAREAKNQGLLGSFRGALSIYYADNEGIYPGVLSILKGRYISLMGGDDNFLPYPVATIPHDTLDPLNSVNYAGGQAMTYFPPIFSETGGFGYRLRPFNPPFTSGHVFINCSHLDTRGVIWSSR